MNYLTTEDGKPINDNNPLAVKDSGTAGTGITPPTGATGTLGWLSGVYNALVTAGIKIGAGTALIGKVGIDQTTDGTTNRVVAKISQTAGENLVVLSGSILAEQKTQADAVTNVITFSQNITTIEIYHIEATWQTFTVNGIAIKVPAGGYRTPVGGTPAKTVTIPAGINCIVGRLI